jgi:hippurate hydrolase
VDGDRAHHGRHRDRWAGTLVLMGQPAEETLRGAQWMIEAGLLTRFPKPTAALAGPRRRPLPRRADRLPRRSGAEQQRHHPSHDLRRRRPRRPAGSTVDPVVIAARTVLALQTIVSREVSPFDAAVITVGTIHAGTKANIIPGRGAHRAVRASLTAQVRAHLLSAIDRIVKAEALAGRSPREPIIDRFDGTDALVNDPALTAARVGRAAARARTGAGQGNEPEMPSEDFSRLHGAGIRRWRCASAPSSRPPSAGARSPATTLPRCIPRCSRPTRERTLKAAITAEVLALRELMPAGAR